MQEIFRVFLRLGTIGFGGPIALIAMMEEELVRKRGWITQAEFTEAYSVCKLLPGPVAVQMAIHLGLRRGGNLGAVIAGLAFTGPSFLMILLLSVFYVRAGSSNHGSITHAFAAMQTAAIALIMLSTWGMAKPYVRKTTSLILIVASFCIIYKLPTWEPIVILAFGAVGIWLAVRKPRPARALSVSGPLALLLAGSPLSNANSAEVLHKLGQLFWTCFKAGEFVFGTGLAILPLLEGELVSKLHWISHAEFLDGMALGQVTPGPMTIAVVFFGFKVAGLLGSLVAYCGIYIPAFFNIIVVLPRVWKRISGTPGMAGFASWAFPAVVGGIAAATVKLSMANLTTPMSALLLLACLIGAMKLKVPSWALIPAAGILGIFM